MLTNSIITLINEKRKSRIELYRGKEDFRQWRFAYPFPPSRFLWLCCYPPAPTPTPLLTPTQVRTCLYSPKQRQLKSIYNQSKIIFNKTMSLSKYVDPTRCWQLLSGVLGIYFTYLVTGIIHESMLKSKYENDYTGASQNFTWPSGFLIFPCGATWIIGAIVNHYQIKPEDRVHIPNKKSARCAVTVAISTLTYTYAIYLTNFPVVMMFKSCNLISVILVGVLCSRVKDKKLKLGVKKIVVGTIVTIGIVMFKVFDPESAGKKEKQTEVLGIVLLVISLLADGFLPDFQAEIKTDYKPQPMEMMTEINKWVSIVSFLYSCALLEIVDMFSFVFEHKFFFFHMLAMGVLSTFGQMFVYRMIKQFKQHFPPFVITTRKIFTVGLSIIYYHHETNIFQLLGLFLVFALVTYEFVSELVEEKKKQSEMIEEPNQASKSTSLSIPDVEIEPQTKLEIHDDGVEEEVKNIEKQRYQQRIGGPEETSFSGQASQGILDIHEDPRRI